MADTPLDDAAEAGSLVLEQRFAIVPEWVIDAAISDCAYRLYCVLLRYGQTSGCRMPGRATLAARLHKASKDTVDRALKELVGVGAVQVEHRCREGRHLTNRYRLMSTPPTVRNVSAGGGGRNSAATAGRNRAATVAADLRPNPEFLTENPPPPGPRAVDAASADARPPSGDLALLAACGIADLSQLAHECQRLRAGLGKPQARWSADRLLEVLRDAVSVRGWPARLAAPALRALAADPATLGPMRLPCPGPWWDRAETLHRPAPPDPALIAERDALEARLVEAGGSRVWAQQQARAQLAEHGQPITRLAVARIACHLLDQAETTAC